jgi:hypothetical protein
LQKKESGEEDIAPAEKENTVPAPAKERRTIEETNTQIKSLHRKNKEPTEIAEILNLSIATVKQRMSVLGLKKKSNLQKIIHDEKEIPDSIWNAVKSLNGRAKICSAPGAGRYYTLDGRPVPFTEIMRAVGTVKSATSKQAS